MRVTLFAAITSTDFRITVMAKVSPLPVAVRLNCFILVYAALKPVPYQNKFQAIFSYNQNRITYLLQNKS